MELAAGTCPPFSRPGPLPAVPAHLVSSAQTNLKAMRLQGARSDMRFALLCAALCIGLPLGALAQAQSDVTSADDIAFAFSGTHFDGQIAPDSSERLLSTARAIKAPPAGFAQLQRALSRSELCDAATIIAKEHQLPVQFFTNLIHAESSFDTQVVSWAGAQGIAQFMPGTAAEYGLANPFDPLPAMKASGRFLVDLLAQFGNLGLAAAGYNAGPRRVQDWLEKRGSLPLETRNYVEKITGRSPESWLPSATPAPPVVATFPVRTTCANDSIATPTELIALVNSVVLAPRVRPSMLAPGGRGKRSARPGSMFAKWCQINPSTCRKPIRIAAG